MLAADEVNDAMLGVPLHLGAAGTFTVTVTWRVTALVPHRAVSVYVVVCAGVTVLEPAATVLLETVSLPMF